ncbi:MAG: D-glycero-beta-D-manno-heptose-1,7-bisphosphate 7-phosphatase [Dehalococcoidales bacterium]|jgi:histidinol-phosphate phosphatase family protein|nr:D-glycero-beta-D-manno-heptose-1,7-bisphosphate 7-phosphatase [Dehalococcoidales bacterium]MDP6577050.1 D-glycero-beta-D-manno-heptose 1,7-bisphosphate 7-phosphatase [Dehalococcoidales bacterium]MDP6825117.1 D-glycero-beta-D-manno-heptose 1,7-bisphosphate 7-phosphatase [Dehalococcoidales bacterium]
MADRAVFLDRDGTMAEDVSYCCRAEDFRLLPNTARAIELLNEHGFKVIVVTNQSGVGRGYFTEETLADIHKKMKRELAREGARVDAIYYCPHHPDDNCDCRKPKPGMIRQAVKDYDIDLKYSFVMGDMMSDIAMGKAAGCRTVFIGRQPPVSEGEAAPEAIAPDMLEATYSIIG